MGKKLKIAAVVRELPIPVYAGLNLIIHNILRRLAKRHDVHVFVLDKTSYEDTSGFGVPYTGFSPTKDAEHRDHPTVSRLARYYRATPEKLAWLTDTLNHYRPDVITGFGYDLAPYFGLLHTSAPKVFDVVDSEVLYLWRQITRGRFSIANTKHLLASVATARSYLTGCDALITVSDEDTTNIRRLTGNRHTFTVSNGVDCDFFVPDTSVKRTPGRIIFTGSLNWPPNQMAIQWFLNSCWKNVLAARPDASLIIIGKLLQDDLKRDLERHTNVQVVGFVPDIRSYVQTAEVSIAPMVSGSGIKNKVLEAWAMGQAVVATPLAARGLRCAHDQDILIGADAKEFAEAVVNVLSNETLRSRLGDNGRSNVVSNYSWDGVVTQFEAVLSGALTRSPHQRTN